MSARLSPEYLAGEWVLVPRALSPSSDEDFNHLRRHDLPLLKPAAALSSQFHYRPHWRAGRRVPLSTLAGDLYILTTCTPTVGKRSLASITAKALGWDVIIADTVFSELAKQDILTYVQSYGWTDFRDKESKILSSLLERYPTNRVIACGGGVIEREENRRLLKAFGEGRGPVIYIMREKDAVLRYLESSTAQYPDYSRATAAERWDVRDAYFRQCSSHEFVSLSITPSSPSSNPSLSSTSPTSSTSRSPDAPYAYSDIPPLALKPIETSFMRLLRFIFGTGTNQIPINPGAPRSFLLSLAFPDLSTTSIIPLLPTLSIGIDAWEVRADCLGSIEPSYVAFQLAVLRRHSELPIVFSVRTREQGGNFPNIISQSGVNASGNSREQDDLQRQLYDLLILAYKLGCEYVDLSLSLPEPMLLSLLSPPGPHQSHRVLPRHPRPHPLDGARYEGYLREGCKGRRGFD